MLVPVRFVGCSLRVAEVVPLRSPGSVNWERRMDLPAGMWEIDYPFGVTTRVLNPVTNRPEETNECRVPPLELDSIQCVDSVQLSEGPLLFGVHNVIFSVSLEMDSAFGVRPWI